MLAVNMSIPNLTQNILTPGVIYGVDLRHCLSDHYQIWWTYRL